MVLFEDGWIAKLREYIIRSQNVTLQIFWVSDLQGSGNAALLQTVVRRVKLCWVGNYHIFHLSRLPIIAIRPSSGGLPL